MVIGLVSIVTLTATALFMLLRSRFMATKRVALVALGMSGAEALMLGLLTASANPVVTMLLIAGRVGMLICCAAAMHRDREMAKARTRRRNRFTADMHNVMVPLRIVRRKNNAAQVVEVA